MHAALASQRIDADAIDSAMLSSLGEDKGTLYRDYEIVKFKPFDPVSKRSEATVKRKSDGHVFKAVKGAPQVILHIVHNEAEIQDVVNQTILEFAGRGYRTLGVAYCDEPRADASEEKWVYEGYLSPAFDAFHTPNSYCITPRIYRLIPMFDPPRHDTKDVIEKVRKYGISVKMITGDQLAIAKETCRDLGNVKFLILL